ncbi:MAG: diacylglycerol/lipid kinase family protein [Methylophilus sp.]|uniref:diacylglycerol/lipid kinase family protein n=1 Tax=Methylophilus sp. TaxID=29541 RepID=UPI003FA1155A
MTNSHTPQSAAAEQPADQLPPLFVIMNAGSGDTNAETVADKLATLFAEAEQPYELFFCRQPGDLPEMTSQAIQQASKRNGVVAAAGGDGTIRFVAQEVIAADLPFGIVPLGTFNYFARDNGVPLELDPAAKALLAGIRARSERQIQVGELNEQVFLVNASLGLYPQLLVDREALKKQHGRSRIVAKLAAFLTLLKRDIQMLLRMEHSGGEEESGEKVIPASTIFVGNNALQLADIGLAAESESVKNRQLAIIALPPMSAGKRIGVAFHGMLGVLSKAPEVTHFACRQLVVEPLSRRKKRLVKVAMDGEVSHMQPPLTFRVGPKCLRLIAAVSPGDET